MEKLHLNMNLQRRFLGLLFKVENDIILTDVD